MAEAEMNPFPGEMGNDNYNINVTNNNNSIDQMLQ